jgi:uncharacterized protein YcbK (DUF882 family)
MIQLSKRETRDKVVAKWLEFAEYPKARAYDAHSRQVAKEATHVCCNARDYGL